MASSIPKSFVKIPLQNGVGRHVNQLQKLVLKFCKSNGSSLGIRNFIETKLLDFTKANPGVVVYLKPRRNRMPSLYGVYLNGGTDHVHCANKSKEDICQWVTYLNDKAGFKEHRLIHRWHTDTPSIQGMWSPYVNKDPKLNITEFPSDLPEFKFQRKEITATELILEKARKLSLKDKKHEE